MRALLTRPCGFVWSNFGRGQRHGLAEIVLGWSDRHGFRGNESGVAPAQSGVLAVCTNNALIESKLFELNELSSVEE